VPPCASTSSGGSRRGTAHALDEAAQVLEDSLTTPVFVHELAKRLAKPKVNPRMEQRLNWLRGIPFRAILTLNFDGYLQGATPSTAAYQSVLRPTNYEWWDERYWRKGSTGAKVLKLHGDFDASNSIVFTRRGYRRLLYENPAYLSFLRAVLAEHTVLYLGFSFADAYLNELRSEALAMLGYAILNDASATTCAHLRRTEGVEVISYDSKSPPDYQGFDQALAEIHDLANPAFRFSVMLAGKRILWVDPKPNNNQAYVDFFKRIAQIHREDRCQIEVATNALDALKRLAAQSFDLVITHWGSREVGPTAITLLHKIRSADLKAPVIAFSSDHQAGARKREALALGAQGYHFTTGGLLRAIERIFTDAIETG
jgi:SIR2-like domain